MTTGREMQSWSAEAVSGPGRAAGAQAARRHAGQRNHVAGICAEDIVARHYDRQGRAVTDRRWRGRSGEIDLVARDGEDVVFVEVKAARDFATAADRISLRQMARLYGAATEYMDTLPGGGARDLRFDVALVDGQGRIEILENAFAA